MDSPKDLVSQLNEILDADHFERKILDSVLKSFKDHYNPSIKFLDFNYYSERLLRKLKKEKTRLVKIQDFENAAKVREQERECQGYITIRVEYNIEKSSFYYDQNYLFYFYLGNAKNDKRIKRFLHSWIANKSNK